MWQWIQMAQWRLGSRRRRWQSKRRRCLSTIIFFIFTNSNTTESRGGSVHMLQRRMDEAKRAACSFVRSVCGVAQVMNRPIRSARRKACCSSGNSRKHRIVQAKARPCYQAGQASSAEGRAGLPHLHVYTKHLMIIVSKVIFVYYASFLSGAVNLYHLFAE